MEYNVHIICDDGYEVDLPVTASNPEQASKQGFWDALEQCLCPVEVKSVTEDKL